MKKFATVHELVQHLVHGYIDHEIHEEHEKLALFFFRIWCTLGGHFQFLLADDSFQAPEHKLFRIVSRWGASHGYSKWLKIYARVLIVILGDVQS